MSQHDHRGGEHHARPVAAPEQAVADVGRRGARGPRPPGRSAPQQPPQQYHDEPAQDGQPDRGRQVGPHRRRQREQDHHRDGGLDDLAGDAFPDDRADTAADVTGVAPGAHRAVHVADHATGQRRVQEDRAVAVGDRGTQRQPHAEPAGDQAPPPGAADRGQRADRQRRDERLGVDQAQPAEERAGTQPPQQQGQDGDAADRPYPRPPRPRLRYRYAAQTGLLGRVSLRHTVSRA